MDNIGGIEVEFFFFGLVMKAEDMGYGNITLSLLRYSQWPGHED